MNNPFFLSSLRGFPASASIEMALRCGYDGIEIQTDYLPQDEGGLHHAACLLEKSGLLCNLHAPSGDINIAAANAGIRRESIAQVKRVIDLAKEFCADVVTVHPGRLSSLRENPSEKWEVLLESLGEIGEYARKAHVKIGLENMEQRLLEIVLSPEDLNRAAAAFCENEFTGVTLDLSHFCTAGFSAKDIPRIALPIFNLHFSQCVGRKPHFPLDVPGGTADLAASMQVLLSGGYRGAAVIEVKNCSNESQLTKNLIAAHSLCRV